VAFERITTDPDVMGGLPCIRGLRMPVATVVAMVADGTSVAQIIDDFPYLTAEDVAEALRYAAEAVRGRELPLRHPARGFCLTRTCRRDWPRGCERLATTFSMSTRSASRVQTDLDAGAVVVLSETTLRIHRLPIGSD
jgi:uncharacterized protein (DUF433 family)